MTRLPIVVGFGGFNAAGRSSGHMGYKRMIFESLNQNQRADVVTGLASIMGKINCEDGICSKHGQQLDEQLIERLTPDVLAGTLVRRIENSFFSVDNTPIGKGGQIKASEAEPVRVTMSARDLPNPLPYGWTLKSEQKGQCEVEIWKDQQVVVAAEQEIHVQAAGQLPTGFNPGSYYRSAHHPRGLQLSILGASDAVQSMGIDWQRVLAHVAPDEVAVYSSSVMSQLDDNGFGGLMRARSQGSRATSKQLALGLNTMPADFINAYVLGSVGVTGGVTGACATFLYNLRAGVEEIKSGRRRVAIVGSSEAPIIPEVIDGYSAMGALATDADLRKLCGSQQVDYRRASRPFGDNCGFTLAESGQYVVLMDDELALELGANIYAAVPGVYINADGFKKSISAPGPGNYITMGKAVGLAQTLLGAEAVQRRSFVQAHGSSTPQNRVTESRIFDQIARAYGIELWPVAAVKAYLGHSLGPASGDQMMATLGVFAHGVLPGIKTIDQLADDVFAERLSIHTSDQDLGVQNCQIGFLNSKGFGGNNATATVFAPAAVEALLQQRHGQVAWSAYCGKREAVAAVAAQYLDAARLGNLSPIYEFGNKMIDEEHVKFSEGELTVPGFSRPVKLHESEGFDDLVFGERH